jgi:hypothetical protein
MCYLSAAVEAAAAAAAAAVEAIPALSVALFLLQLHLMVWQTFRSYNRAEGDRGHHAAIWQAAAAAAAAAAATVATATAAAADDAGVLLCCCSKSSCNRRSRCGPSCCVKSLPWHQQQQPFQRMTSQVKGAG